MMVFLKIRALPRQRVAVLSLTGITICKLALFLILLTTRTVQPYIGPVAQSIYLPAANRILTSGTYNELSTSYSSMAAPGYAVFLALVQWIDARQYVSIVVCLQMLFDYCVALLLLFLGNRETSLKAGWLAGILWLVFPPAVIMSTWITSETLFTALLTLSIVMLTRSLSQQVGVGLSFAAGLALGLTTLVRGTTQFFPVFFFATLCGRGIPKRLLKCIFFFVGLCLLVLPWTLRNLYVLGEPIVQTGFGAAFLAGSRSEYLTVPSREAAEEWFLQPPDSVDKKITAQDRWRFHRGLREYRLRLEQQPLSFFPFVIHKFVRLWYGTDSGILYQQFILGVCSLLIVPMGLYQFWLWRSEHLPLSLILGLLFLYFTVLHIVTLPLVRYTVPLYPFLIFSASHQYITLFKVLRARLVA